MPKPFKTRDAALASLKAVSFHDPFFDFQRDAEGRIMEDEDQEPLWVAKDIFPQVFAHPDHDKGLVLSAEDEKKFANYYGEYDGEVGDDDPWVHPLIEAWATEHGYIVEWRDPGSVTLFPN